jgi:hypothetical protein
MPAVTGQQGQAHDEQQTYRAEADASPQPFDAVARKEGRAPLVDLAFMLAQRVAGGMHPPQVWLECRRQRRTSNYLFGQAQQFGIALLSQDRAIPLHRTCLADLHAKFGDPVLC